MSQVEETTENNNPFKYVDGIYCLNLPRSVQRKKEMEKQFLELGWSARFIRGIHPDHHGFNKLIRDKDKVDMTASNKRCYCPKKCKHHARKLRLTEIAICLSHLNAYKRVIKRENRWALICEDDVIFLDNLAEIINQVVPEDIWITDKPAMIFLGARDNPGLQVCKTEDFSFHPSPRGIYSNYCYLINSPAVAILIKNFYPITRPEDSYKRYLIGRGKIAGFQIKPGLVAELSSGVNGAPKYRRLSHFYRLPKHDWVNGELRPAWQKQAIRTGTGIGAGKRVLRIAGESLQNKRKRLNRN